MCLPAKYSCHANLEQGDMELELQCGGQPAGGAVAGGQPGHVTQRLSRTALAQCRGGRREL